MHTGHIAIRARHKDECFWSAWSEYKLRSHFNGTRNVARIRVTRFDMLKMMPNMMIIGENIVVIHNTVGIFKWWCTTKCYDCISVFNLVKTIFKPFSEKKHNNFQVCNAYRTFWSPISLNPFSKAEIIRVIFLFAAKSLLHDFASTIKTTSVVLGTSDPDILKITPSATYDPFIKLQLHKSRQRMKLITIQFKQPNAIQQLTASKFPVHVVVVFRRSNFPCMPLQQHKRPSEPDDHCAWNLWWSSSPYRCTYHRMAMNLPLQSN